MYPHAINPADAEPDPNEIDHDPVAYAIRMQRWDEAAEHMREGESYRLRLDDAEREQLDLALGRRGMVLNSDELGYLYPERAQ